MSGGALLLAADEPDVYGDFGRAASQARRWRRWAVALACVIAVQGTALGLLALRPPYVLVHDRAAQGPPTMRRLQFGDRADARDARLFFTQMVGLRFGWQSDSVRRDLETFLAQCHPTHRKAQLRHLLAPQSAAAGEGAAVDAERVGSGPNAFAAAASRLDAWQRGSLRNEVVLPETWDEVHCRVRAHEPVWDCAMVARLVTKVDGPGGAAGGAGVAGMPATFVATLLEVPHTVQTPYGLLVAHLDLLGGATGAHEAQEVVR